MELAQICSGLTGIAFSQCIKDAATGGGLMPEIVVIPIGVMVVGLIAGMVWSLTRPWGPQDPRRGRALGFFLVFASLCQGAIGVGLGVAESRAAGSMGGYGIAALVNLVGAGLMFFFGLLLTRVSVQE